MMLRRVIIWGAKVCFYLFRIFPISNRKIVFSNFGGKGFGDNPKYIALALNDLDNYDMVWLCDKADLEMPGFIRCVKRESVRGIYEMVTAKVWIDNSRKPYYVRKRKAQKYIQTWHGAIGLKKFELDAAKGFNKDWERAIQNDSHMIDLLLVNSEWGIKNLKRALGYNGEIAKVGSPRNDLLFCKDNNMSMHIKEKLGIGVNDKCALYAPTFRDDYSISAYDIDFGKVIDKLTLKWPGNWKIMIRLHPIITDRIHELGIHFDQNIINVTEYPDMTELMAISDLLITDYSSCSLDIGVAYKRVLLYANDIEQYCQDRGMHFSIDELPYPCARNMDELLYLISNFSDEQYLLNLRVFNDSLGVFEDGKASIRVAQIVNGYMTVTNN